jgi:hypothetical protein
VLISKLDEHAPEQVLENAWRDLEWTRDPEVRAGVRPVIADEAKTAQFPASKGTVLSNEAQALVLDCVLDEFIAAILCLERLAAGNYEPDERPSQFPEVSGRHGTMGTGDSKSIPVIVLRLCGHRASGPRLVFDQSKERIREPSCTPPSKKKSFSLRRQGFVCSVLCSLPTALPPRTRLFKERRLLALAHRPRRLG